VRAKVRENSWGGRSETTRVGFVKEVGFKPGVKDGGSYGWAEWWIRRGRSDGRRIGEVSNVRLSPSGGVDNTRVLRTKLKKQVPSFG